MAAQMKHGLRSSGDDKEANGERLVKIGPVVFTSIDYRTETKTQRWPLTQYYSYNTLYSDPASPGVNVIL